MLHFILKISTLSSFFRKLFEIIIIEQSVYTLYMKNLPKLR